MSDPTDLVAWLTACYDRAEQRARDAMGDPDDGDPWDDPNGEFQSRGGPVFDHVVAYGPASRLTDIARKRKIVADIAPAATGLDLDMDTETGQTHRRDLAADPYLGDRLLRLLAEEFDGERGYDESWRP